MSKNNQNFKNIYVALNLDDLDVVSILAFGGLSITRSKANAWRRINKPRHRQNGHSQASRAKVMNDEEFACFCLGLIVFQSQKEKE